MSGAQQIGVEAVFNTGNFVAGVNVYTGALDRMVAATRVAASSMFVQPQIIGLDRFAQAVQDSVYQSRLLRTEFTHLKKQQSPFASLTKAFIDLRGHMRDTQKDARATGNIFNHVTDQRPPNGYQPVYRR